MFIVNSNKGNYEGFCVYNGVNDDDVYDVGSDFSEESVFLFGGLCILYYDFWECRRIRI